ncbi:MAG TPA: rod shape-determining protein RodA [Bryobacteraceae bacterium]|nr:rod shape-determining protein RodA [Bryobacteraceae bacterium]
MMLRFARVKDFDWTMFFIVMTICALGVLQIFSATHDTVWQGSWWKQILYIMAGLVLAWIATNIDYHALMGHVYTLYIASVGLLVVVLLVGKRAFGSTRWILLPAGIHLQISEFAKIAIILLVARFMTELKTEVLEWRDLLKLSAAIVLPMALIAKEPDLGTALTYLPILAVGVYLAGMRWKYWVVIGVLLLVVVPVAYSSLHAYQKARIVSFLDPERDPQGTGYQLIQSRIAVGAGGTWGKGVTKGSQTQLRFLPVPHTDFIFSAFAEEHGFIGVMVVMVLFFVLLMQIVQNAQTSPDRAGMYICMGVGSLLLFHILVNVGMVVGRMPVTGIPLPLMSYGGSSIWSTFLMLGLVNSVRVRRFVN